MSDTHTLPSPRKSRARPIKVAYRRSGNTSTRLLKDGSEAVWPEELQTAMMEALVTYPASESRVKLTDGTSSTRTVVLGRCQLVQQFIKEKTGKIRTRKQIASRLQRLRQIYHNDPRMMDLVRSGRSTSRRSEQTHNAGSPDGSAAGTPIQGVISSASSESCREDANRIENVDPNSLNMVPQVLSILSDGELPENLIQAVEFRPQIVLDSASLTDCIHWQPPSMSRRRLASNIPALQLQVELPPLPAFGSIFNSDIGQYTSHDPTGAGRTVDPTSYFGHTIQHPGPFTPVDQITHTPDHPPELHRPAKRLPFHRRNVLDPYGRHLSAFSPAQYDMQSGPPQASHLGSTEPASLDSYRPQSQSSLSSSSALSPYQSCYNSPYQSPSLSPYPSPIDSPLLRSTSHMVFDNQPHMAFDNHQQWMEQHVQAHQSHPFVRRLSYQHPSRHVVPSSMPSSRTNLSVSHVFGDNVAQSFDNLELASPVAIRPFFSAFTPSSSMDSSLGSIAGNFEEDNSGGILPDGVTHPEDA